MDFHFISSIFSTCFLFFLTDVLIGRGFKNVLTTKTKQQDYNYDINTLSLLSGEKITSTIHNVIAIYFATKVLADNTFWLDKSTRLYHVSDSSYNLGCVSGGYFLYDLFTCLVRFRTSGFIYLIHALVGLFVYASNTHNKNGHFYNALFIMFELSTPFVNSRWFLKNYYHHHDYYKANTVFFINDALLFLTFFIARILWGSYCTFLVLCDLNSELFNPHSLISPIYLLLQLLPIITTNVLNFYWFHLMLLKLINYILH
jgi:hypothetical protein